MLNRIELDCGDHKLRVVVQNEYAVYLRKVKCRYRVSNVTHVACEVRNLFRYCVASLLRISVQSA